MAANILENTITVFTPSSYKRYEIKNFLGSFLPHISFRVFKVYLKPLIPAWANENFPFVSAGRKRKAGIEHMAKKTATISQVASNLPALINRRANKSEIIDPV